MARGHPPPALSGPVPLSGGAVTINGTTGAGRQAPSAVQLNELSCPGCERHGVGPGRERTGGSSGQPRPQDPPVTELDGPDSLLPKGCVGGSEGPRQGLGRRLPSGSRSVRQRWGPWNRRGDAPSWRGRRFCAKLTGKSCSTRPSGSCSRDEPMIQAGKGSAAVRAAPGVLRLTGHLQDSLPPQCGPCLPPSGAGRILGSTGHRPGIAGLSPARLRLSLTKAACGWSRRGAATTLRSLITPLPFPPPHRRLPAL